MSNLSSNASSDSKPCTLKMKDGEISQIVELFNNDHVHVVDISVSLPNVSHGKELLSDFHVQIMNPIGREILFALNVYGSVQWTLTVGIEDFKLQPVESQNGCITKETMVTKFALETVQNIVRRINLATNYDVWYSFKEILSVKECCHVSKLDLLKCNDGCSKSYSYLFHSLPIWDVIHNILIIVLSFCISWCILHFQSLSDFDVKYSKYYKLEESRMSPSFIFFKIIWEENSRIISCIRVCALVSGLLLFLSFAFKTFFGGIYILAVLGFSVLGYVMLFLLWGDIATPSPSELSESRNQDIEFSFDEKYSLLVWLGYDAQQLRQELKICENIGMIKVFTSIFNIKLLRKANKTIDQTFFAKHVKFNNLALKFLAKCLCYAFGVFSYFCFVLSLLPFHSFPPIVYLKILSNRIPSAPKIKLPWKLLYFLLFVLLVYLTLLLPCVLFLISIVLIPRAIVSLLLGLFLNLIFFIPYLAFFSVLTFYCVSYWKSMEEKYLLLKQLIYEACRDIKHDYNDFEPNRRLKRNERVLPVVSKQLYDKIREKLLPYDENLFYLAVKLLCAFAFSFAIFQLIIMLREFEVTGFVQVLTTASLGVMPHIFNTARLKTSEQMKVAWKEKIKLNVKYMIEKTVGKNSKHAMELFQTEVIIPWQESDENILIQGMELFQKWTNEMTVVNRRKTFGKIGITNQMTQNNCDIEYITRLQEKIRTHEEDDRTNEMTDDNDEVNDERVELLQTEVIIHQEYETTNEMTDDNDEVNDERVELLQTEVIIHQEHDTTNEMTNDNDGIFARFLKLFQLGRYFQEGRRPEQDKTIKKTDGNDEVNDERVELLQTEVMIHQEHDTTNEMTNDNDGIFARFLKLFQLGRYFQEGRRPEQDKTIKKTDGNDEVNEERVELLQAEVAENRTRIDKNLRSTQHGGIAESNL